MQSRSGRTFVALAGWLHCPPLGMLIFAALLLGLAPFWPEPHLLQKAQMLSAGQPLRPIDWLDIAWHAWPLLWLLLRLATPGAAGYCRIPERRT